MRLFLTGSTGFIGSHVLAAALKAGHQVRALRRSPSSIPVIPLPSEPEWCEGDLSSLRATDLEGVEAVLHLASAGVSPKPASWDELMQVNVLGSLRLLERAAEAAVLRFVVAGSCHEYGNAARRYSKFPRRPPGAPEPIRCQQSVSLPNNSNLLRQGEIRALLWPHLLGLWGGPIRGQLLAIA